MKKTILALLWSIFMFSLLQADTATVWSKEKAQAYMQRWGWLRGCNFQPSTAINQLEMWQAESFDAATIEPELGSMTSCVRTVRPSAPMKSASSSN